MRAQTSWQGRCHCGAIGFDYTCELPPAEWPIRACQCRFCRCHYALSTSTPDAVIRFRAASPTQLTRYRFGLRTADFLLCRQCGVYIGAVIETPRGRFGIINTHSLDPQPEDLAAATAISYDGEQTDGRVQRREQRWANVSEVPW